MSGRHVAALGALVTAVAVLLVLEGVALPTAWLPVEEAAAVVQARGGGLPQTPSGGVLYPALVAPAAHRLSPEAAHAFARGLSAVLWAAIAVPAFLLARRLVPPGAALAVAGLAVVAPASVYATAAVPDALAVLLAVSSLPLLARASERGSGRALAGAVAVAGLAALARPWLAVLPFALVVAYGLAEIRRPSFLRWPRSLAFAALAGGAYLVLGATAPHAAIAFASPGTSARAAAAGVAVAALGAGIAPWLLAASAARPLASRPEAALLATCLPALALAAGVLGVADPGRSVDERPLLVLAPLVLALAATAWLRGGRLLAPAAAVGGLLAVAALMLPAVGRAPTTRAAGLSVISPEGGSRGYLVAAVWAAVAVAFLAVVVLRRRRALLAAALALVLVVGQVAAWSTVRAEARALVAVEPLPRGWVDARVPPGSEVLVAGPAETLDERLVAQLTLWNRSIRGAQVLDLGYVDPESGQWGEAAEAGILLTRGVELAGAEIARSAAGILVEPQPALRLAETVEGLFEDGWSGEQAVYRRFSGLPEGGTVVVSVRRPGWGGEGGPAEIAVESGPRDGELDRRTDLVLRAGEAHEVEIDVPGPPSRVVVTVRPTIPAPDGRQLGARLRFEYRP